MFTSLRKSQVPEVVKKISTTVRMALHELLANDKYKFSLISVSIELESMYPYAIRGLKEKICDVLEGRVEQLKKMIPPKKRKKDMKYEINELLTQKFLTPLF